MTPEEILAAAPPKVRDMPPEMQERYVQRQLEKLSSPEYLARKAQEQADAEALAAIKADAFVQKFIAMTPQQVTDYVNNNTASLAQVRALMVKMALMLLALGRRELR